MLPEAEKTSVELQDRDADILRGLLDSRLLTLGHIVALYFHGRHEAGKKRVQKLKAAGLIGERKRKVYEPSVLFLTRQGFALLTDRGLLAQFPQLAWANLERRLQVSDLTIRHELEVADVKAAFANGLRNRPTYSLTEFSTWPVLFQFKASHDGGTPMLVKPDGFVRIEERDANGAFEHTFFVEVDRSTETLDTVARKALCYLNYYQRGGLAIQPGPQSEYRDFPFRVLMIFKTEERRDNVAKKLLEGHPPILTQVWLTTKKDIGDDPIGTIWLQPKEYIPTSHIYRATTRL